MHAIELKKVSYRYSGAEPDSPDAVRCLDLTVDAGELKLVTGASGCGKTTVMRLVNGLCPQIYTNRWYTDIVQIREEEELWMHS